MSEIDWFNFAVDIQIAEPEFDEETNRYSSGLLSTTELSQEQLKELFDDEGWFKLRVDACTDELCLRVLRSNVPGEESSPEHDLVFINLGRRNAERLRDALDAALKLTEPKNERD
jgi:hypothetical protein